MNCIFFTLSILLVISGLSLSSKFRGIPRRGRSDPIKREVNDDAKPRDVYDRCMGFPGLVPPQLYTTPDDSDNISLIVRQPTQWVLRDISSIPNPFFAEGVSEARIYFCLDGDRTFFHDSYRNYSNGNGYLSIIVDKVDNPSNISFRGFFWELLAQSSYCGCDKEGSVITVQAVKFLNYPNPYEPSDCPGCWIGLFTLCASPECTDRITSIQVDNEHIPLLPLVMTAYIQHT